MTKHIADQPRDRIEGTRAREYTRIEREGAAGRHPSSEELQRRPAETAQERPPHRGVPAPRPRPGRLTA